MTTRSYRDSSITPTSLAPENFRADRLLRRAAGMRYQLSINANPDAVSVSLSDDRKAIVHDELRCLPTIFQLFHHGLSGFQRLASFDQPVTVPAT